MIIAGIDPDLNGGIAVIDTDTRSIIRLDRMPVFEPPVSGSRRIDGPGAYECLKAARMSGAEYVVIEAALVKPQRSSKGEAMMGSIHTVHQNFGALRAICEVLFTRSRVIEAWPSSWKKEMGLSRDKSLSLDEATRFYPGHASLFGKAKNAGLAESVLLVEWAIKKLHLSSQAS